MSDRIHSPTGCRPALLVGSLLLLGASQALAIEPQSLSPGRAEAPVTLVQACPTFSWNEVRDAVGYELEIVPAVLEHRTTGPPRRITLPAGTLSWTAADADCLAPGIAHLWRLRPLRESGAGDWSRARELRIAPESPALSTARRLLTRLGAERLSPAQLHQLRLLGWEGRSARAPVGSAGPPAGGVPERRGPLAERSVSPPSSRLVHLDNEDAFAVWAKASGVSIWGESASSGGQGIHGVVDEGEAVVSTTAVEGRSEALSGIGILGEATIDPGNNSTITTGVRGSTLDGIGLLGRATAESGAGVGVYGESASPRGRGVCAMVFPTKTSTAYGAWGESASPGGYDFYAGGAGMDYGPFTGSHEVRLDPSSPLPEPGMVVSLTGRVETRWRPDGSVDLSSTLPTVTLSEKAADPAALGVYVRSIELPADHWLDDRADRYAVINALGEGRVWVTDRNGPIAAGDLLTTSDVRGHAQRQDESGVRSHTLGRAIETVDWSRVTRTVTHGGRTHRAALIAVVYTSG